jgi:hypothetical protein
MSRQVMALAPDAAETDSGGYFGADFEELVKSNKLPI